MYRKVLSRSPFPRSLTVSALLQLPAKKQRELLASSYIAPSAAAAAIPPTSKRGRPSKKQQEAASLAVSRGTFQVRFASPQTVSTHAVPLPNGFKGLTGEVESFLSAAEYLRATEVVAAATSARRKRKERAQRANSVVNIEEVPGERQLVAGVGSLGHIEGYRHAVTNAVRRAQKLQAGALVLHPPAEPTLPITNVANIFNPPVPLSSEVVAEKTALFAVTAAYQYNRLKTGAAAADTLPPPPPPASKKRRGHKATAPTVPKPAPMEVYVDSPHKEAVARGSVVGGCINDARNLGNLREDEGIPAFYAEWARKELLPLSRHLKLRRVMHGEQIREAGLDLLYSVGKGSIHEPYVLVLEYVGDRRSSSSTALVGKGVTFDCGGHNIKPYGSMETMYTDMMGAGTVLGTMKAAAALQLPINLVAAVGLVENAIGPDSYFPSTILTSLKGTTVEVLNTDAEGRLVLADVLTYIQRPEARLEKHVETIIDVATLTGAIIIGLGTHRAGSFCNHAPLATQLTLAGSRCGEQVWPMPVGEEHMQLMRGGVADLVNAAPGRAGGSCTAAAFLSHFIEDGRRWAHLDIAGVADVGDKPRGYNPAGVTGFGVQLLVDHLRGGNVAAPPAPPKPVGGRRSVKV